MTYSSPPPLNQPGPSDQDYAEQNNANFGVIDDNLEAIAAELLAIQQAQGSLASEDLRRVLSVSSPDGGRIGDSLRFELVAGNTFALRASQDGQSHAIISGTRYAVGGDLSGDFSDLGLSDGAYTVFVGVDPLGSSLSLGMSTTESNVSLPLYQFEITVSGTGATYTVDKAVLIPETRLPDNALIQGDRQARVFSRTIHKESASSGDKIRFTIPVEATINRMELYQVDDLGLTTASLKSADGATTYIVDVLTSGVAADTLHEQAPSASWENVVFAAGTEFLLEFTTVTSPGEAFLTAEFGAQGANNGII